MKPQDSSDTMLGGGSVNAIYDVQAKGVSSREIGVLLERSLATVWNYL